MAYKSLKPFGPSILKGKINQSDIDELLTICDNADKKAGDELVGFIEEEYHVKNGLLGSSVYNNIKGLVRKYLDEVDAGQYAKLRPLLNNHLDLAGAWVNLPVAGEYNPLHNHIGHSIIAVIYPKIDMKSKFPYTGYETGSYNVATKPGYISFSFGSQMNDGFGIQEYIAYPEEGDIFIFPAQLLHYTGPIFDNDVRISVSCNFIFTEKARKDMNSILEKSSKTKDYYEETT